MLACRRSKYSVEVLIDKNRKKKCTRQDRRRARRSSATRMAREIPREQHLLCPRRERSPSECTCYAILNIFIAIAQSRAPLTSSGTSRTSGGR